MHFLLTAIGSYGDVHPMVGLGAMLRTRGHRVSIATNPYFADVVERAELNLLPIGSVDDYRSFINHPHVWNTLRAPAFIFREVVAGYMKPLYELLMQHHVPGETVIAAHMLDAASPLLRDKHGARVARVVFSPSVFWSPSQPPNLGLPNISSRWPAWWNQLQFATTNRLMVDRVIKRPVNQFRKPLGLDRVTHIWKWWFGTDMNLCLFPEWFAPSQPGWPDTEPVGFPLWDAGETTPLSDEVESFLAAGNAPFVFTPGSANKQAADFFQTAVDACRQLGRRGILLSKFPEQLPARLPDDVRHFDFVPLSRLLPHAAVFVHHGGVGSSSQGLAAGVPQLIRPLAFDQFDNAERLRTLGVAEEVRPQRFTEKRVAESLQRLTSSTAVAASCKQYAARLAENNALQQACIQLETLGVRGEA